MIGFIYNMMQAEKKDKQADKTNVKAFEKITTAEKKKDQQKYETRMTLEKLANRKKGILLTSMKDFIQTYEKIMKIDFQEGEGIRELGWESMPPGLVKEISSMSSVAGIPMTSGQAIATFIFGGISGIIRKESEINASVASIRKKQANVFESQVETMCVALDAIKQRADRIAELLAKLNMLFRKSIETTEVIIDQRGNSRGNYTKNNKESIMTCINLAVTVKKIIDTTLIDQRGEVTKQSFEAIKIGEEYLARLDNIIS